MGGGPVLGGDGGAGSDPGFLGGDVSNGGLDIDDPHLGQSAVRGDGRGQHRLLDRRPRA